MATIQELFATNPFEARERERLDHFLPLHAQSIDQIDASCLDMFSMGRLIIVGDELIRRTMGIVKNPEWAPELFQEYSDRILAGLTRTAARLTPQDSRKAAISIRAGIAFQPAVRKFMRGTPIGFLTQARDHISVTAQSIGAGKMGSFEGKHAVIFDPMLATGGSMVDMIESTLDRGAERITTVSAFSAPQGIARIAMYEEVRQIITAPLEAGLNEKGYIVGGHEPHPMLGDFGDRYFGAIE